MRSRRRLRLVVVIALAAVLAVAGRGVAPGGATTTASETATATAAARPAAAANLHGADWGEVAIPGSFCSVPGPVGLHDGRAFVAKVPSRWRGVGAEQRRSGRTPGITFASRLDPVVYGDLARSGHDDAGLVVDCNNGAGTADGVLAYAWVIYSGAGGRPAVLATVTPRVKQRADRLPTLMRIRIRPGAISVREFFYGAHDGTCCPSGRATTRWSYARGRLRPGVAVITKRPG